METRLLIAGEPVEGTGTPLEVEDPSSSSVLATLRTASAEQIDAALAGAREAQPGWERTPARSAGPPRASTSTPSWAARTPGA